VGKHKIWGKLDRAHEEYQRAIAAYPDQSELAYSGDNGLDLTVTVAPGQLLQNLSDYDKIDEPTRNQR